MKIERMIKCLKEAIKTPSDKKLLYLIAEALGNELSRDRLTVLREFRSQVARIMSAPITDIGAVFLQGYVAAMLDVCAGYDAAIEKRFCENCGQHLFTDGTQIIVKAGDLTKATLVRTALRDRHHVCTKCKDELSPKGFRLLYEVEKEMSKK